VDDKGNKRFCFIRKLMKEYKNIESMQNNMIFGFCLNADIMAVPLIVGGKPRYCFDKLDTQSCCL